MLDDLFGEELRAFGGEVDVFWSLDLSQSRQRGGVQVVDWDAVAVHDFFGDVVVLDVVARESHCCAFGDGGCRGEDHIGAGLLESLCEKLEVLGVLVYRYLPLPCGWIDGLAGFVEVLEVVEAEVEVDDVPFCFAEPRIEQLDSVGCVCGVAGVVVDAGLGCEQVSCGGEVADGDGVADEQDLREGGLLIFGRFVAG